MLLKKDSGSPIDKLRSLNPERAFRQKPKLSKGSILGEKEKFVSARKESKQSP